MNKGKHFSSSFFEERTNSNRVFMFDFVIDLNISLCHSQIYDPWKAYLF